MFASAMVSSLLVATAASPAYMVVFDDMYYMLFTIMPHTGTDES